MAVRIRGVPPDLPDGIYKVRVYRVRNQRGFSIMEAELIELPPPKPRVRLVHNQYGTDFYKVVSGGEVRIYNIPKDEDDSIPGVCELLVLAGVDVLKENNDGRSDSC